MIAESYSSITCGYISILIYNQWLHIYMFRLVYNLWLHTCIYSYMSILMLILNRGYIHESNHYMITTRLMVIFVRNSTNHNAHKTMLMIMIPNATAPIIKFLLYGQDVIKMSGQILISWPIYNMWQKCEKLLSSCQVSQTCCQYFPQHQLQQQYQCPDMAR